MKARGWQLGAMLLIALAGGADHMTCAQQPIHLRQADVMRTEQCASGAMRYLDGHVWITQDTLSITSDHAVYDEAAGQLHFFGNVHFTEPARQFWADDAVYFERDGRAIAERGVRIEQDSVIINCDRVVYYDARNEANLLGNVRIHSLREKAILTGNMGNYSRSDEHGSMTQNPRLVRYFAADDSMDVTGKVIQYSFQDKAATVTDSVHLHRENFDAWGQKLVYREEEEAARLTGDPLLQRGQDVMKADTVDAIFEKDRLRRVILWGKAVATSPADSVQTKPQNWVVGRRIELTFKQDDPDSILVQGNAAGVYFVREKGEERGANRVSGDVIKMWLQNRLVKWIYVEGGAEGIYYPEQFEDLADSDK